MGQANSSNQSSPEHIIPETVSVIQDEVIRQARVLTEIATLSYEDFQQCIKKLNELSRKVTDCNEKQLLFTVLKGTDSTVLWKGTVKIACIKLDPKTKTIENHRVFNLNQFLKIFKTLECQLTAALHSSKKEMESTVTEKNYENKNSADLSPTSPSSSSESSSDSSYHESVSDNSSSSEESEKASDKKDLTFSSQNNLNKTRPRDIKLKNAQIKKFTASILLEEVDNLANIANAADKFGECCICLERKPDMMLPCAHAFCMPCIEQWNTWHKTCPFCRETLDSTDDTWVISDIPCSQEISDEICSSLMDLTSPE